VGALALRLEAATSDKYGIQLGGKRAVNYLPEAGPELSKRSEFRKGTFKQRRREFKTEARDQGGTRGGEKKKQKK